MHYEVQVPAADGGISRFEIRRDKPLVEGDVLDQGTVFYKVLRVLPGHGDFDRVVKAEWHAGPGQLEP